MVGTPAASAVFDFENILPQLDFLPIAARRALDHAGLRLSLEAWRSLGLDDRCQLVVAGAHDVVDSGSVAGVVRRASPPAQRIEVVGDPDPLAPPDGLMRLLEPVPLDARQWARLRALDRYALAHVHRRSIARNDPSLIQAAYEDIVMGHLRSLRPPPGEAGGRSMGSTTPPPDLPPPPGLPRPDGAPSLPRSSRYDVTPTPGFAAELPVRNVEIPAAPRAYDARGYDGVTSPRGHDLGGASRGHEPPSSSRSYDASAGSPYERDVPLQSRNHDAAGRVAATAPSFRRPQELPPAAFDAPPRPFDAPLGARGHDVTPSSRSFGGASSRGHDGPPPVRAHETLPAAHLAPEIHVEELIAEEEEHFHDPIPELTPPRQDLLASHPSSHLSSQGSSHLSSHLTGSGDARMVDVGEKPVTARRAVAAATVNMRRETFRRLAQHDTPKGDVLAAARIAGIQAAKRTSELIPLCHGIALTRVEVHIDLDDVASAVHIQATAEAQDRTGVEMEAMVAVSVAGLTIYDMLKGIDRDMSLTDVKLLEKSGGRTGHYQRREA
jgi:cyclic pyranopterin phosphate synthase